MEAIAKKHKEDLEREFLVAVKKILKTEKCSEFLNKMESDYLKELRATKKDATADEITSIAMHLKAILILKLESDKKHEYR